jgi:predicted transcriptional regulator
VDKRTTQLNLQIIINFRRFCLFCFFISFFLILTAGATEYIVSPAPNDQFGVSLAGENVQVAEITEIPYWHFLLWLGMMNILSAIDMLYQTKLIFAIAGCRSVDSVNILDNPNRSKVYAYIKTRPGAYISEIVEKIGLDRGAVKYHIQTLKSRHKIEAYKDGGKTRFFENNSTYNDEEVKVISALQNVTNKRIVTEILNGKCDTNIALAREFGISRATVSWYMKNLKEIGLILETKKGRRTIYRINHSYKLLIEKYEQEDTGYLR